MNIFNLKADVTLDTSKYKKGLKDAEKQSETSAKKIDDNFKQTSEATASQLNSIQSQYRALVNSSGSIFTDLDSLVKNGLINQSQYSQEYTKALEEFKKQEQEIIDRAKEMGIAFENGKFKIVSAQNANKNAIKNTTQELKTQEQEAKNSAKQQQQNWETVGNLIVQLGNNFDILRPIATTTGKVVGEAATNAGGVWAKVLDIVLKILAAFKQVVTETIEYSNEIYEVSKQFDMTTESVSELQYMASQTGTTLSTITNAMTQLERKAASENSVFEELGVSITDANGKYKSMETVLFDTIGALNELNDESEKSAYMSQLFGRSTMESGELFRLTADEIANLRQESEDLGITMSESTAKYGADITRQIEALKLQGKSALSALLANEDGAEELIASWIDNAMSVVEKYFPKIIKFILKFVFELAANLIKILPNIAAELIDVVIAVIFDINWVQIGLDISKSLAQGILNIIPKILNSLFGWAGVDIPEFDFGVGSSYLGDTDLNTEYEISERMQQDITVKVEASGNTAISKESAEETAKALAPYIDQILGAR